MDNKKRKRYLIIAIIIGLILLFADLQIKKIANQQLPLDRLRKTPVSFVDFYLTHNTGYHYIFGEIKNHKLWSLFGLTMGIILMASISHSILKEKTSKFIISIYTIVLTLTIGAMGNVLEILFTGKATDYFIFHPFPWPSNLCDQYINAIIYIIIPILLVHYIINWFRKKKKTQEVNQINQNG